MMMKFTPNQLAVMFCLGVLLTLDSCATVAEELLVPLAEYDIRQSVSKAKPSSSVSSKQQAKERERLIQANKCPSCNGMGKTPDGRYACMKCNGTGKYHSDCSQQEQQ